MACVKFQLVGKVTAKGFVSQLIYYQPSQSAQSLASSKALDFLNSLLFVYIRHIDTKPWHDFNLITLGKDCTIDSVSFN